MFVLLLQKRAFDPFCSFLQPPSPHFHFRQLQGSSLSLLVRNLIMILFPLAHTYLVKSKRALSLTGCLITKTLYYSYMRSQGTNLPITSQNSAELLLYLTVFTFLTLAFISELPQRSYKDLKSPPKMMIMMIHTVSAPKHHPLTFLCIWNWQAESLSLSSSYTLYNEVFEVPENSKQQKPQRPIFYCTLLFLLHNSFFQGRKTLNLSMTQKTIPN